MYIYYLSSMLFFFYSIMMFYMSFIFFINKFNYFIEWNSMYLNSILMNMYIYIDWMTLMFLFTIFIISSMIMLYSTEYMKHDSNNNRFFWMLLMFIISMMFLILSPNMLSILIGWDGLGLTSYCLIIYYQSKSSFNSGMLTVLINRIGDIFIIMSISLMINYGSFNFMNYNLLNNFILIFMVIAAMTKSAQFPFSSWLPAAMAAPTPVSSLVHSSTLVTAGIYLMIRFNNIIMLNIKMINLMLIIGLITMLMAGLSANFEFDLKKIIAYSTLSQLGLMMMMLSMKLTQMVFFHLIIHAMFKSMMFMCSGIIIHSMNNYQDIRYMGMIKKFLPMTSSMFLISNMALCGMPFYSGFYSKDLILEMNFMYYNNLMINILLIVSTMLTVMYSIRLMFYLMNSNFYFITLYKIYDIKMMNLSMMILMMFSIMFGMMMNWMMFSNIEIIFLFSLEKLIILLMSMMSIFFMLKMFKLMNYINKFYFMKFFLGNMWFLYKFNYLFNINILNFGKVQSLIYDKGWSEEFFKNKFIYMNMKFNLFNIMSINKFNTLMILLSFTIIMFMLL